VSAILEIRASEKLFAFGPHAKAGGRSFSKAILDRGIIVNVGHAFLVIVASLGILSSGLQLAELAFFSTLLLLAVWQYASIIVEVKLDKDGIYVRKFREFEAFPWPNIKSVRFTTSQITGVTWMVVRRGQALVLALRVYAIWAPTYERERVRELGELKTAVTGMMR
jgi:hypothetical protein